ncbi:uncharacterized protein LY89DRAFT_633084 [Mollisia scopiformis]|uniref:Uncharacterized protein n=1 Tax=Mollisia scopiformis TaxID=149040 RepID=A0A132B1Y1_MOLSC|nr:uncharacterized protein LY89DRAFT_633084 [Mollisia scopiformis]KUJ06311.1 hypothetical protein LY89DRAFT_633084 [Mollisia scopiformis]
MSHSTTNQVIPRKAVPTTAYTPLNYSENVEHQRSHETSPTDIRKEHRPKGEVKEPFLQSQSHSLRDGVSPEKLVKWGIHWSTPVFILISVLAGVGFALGHHFYYASLDGTTAGSSSRQQWSTRFGTAFAFLVVAALKTTSDLSYNQYIWTLVRRKSFPLGSLDKMFSLTSNPMGFLSFHLTRHAKIGVFIALISWLTALAGVTPPGTLSVVPNLLNETRLTSLASPNWNSAAFFNNFTLVEPSFRIMAMATQVADSMAITPLTPPQPNSSFTLNFYGPSLQCSAANSTQQPAFDYYTNAIGAGANSNGQYPTLTKSTFENGNLTLNFTGEQAGPYMAVLSAFAPYEGSQGWFRGDTSNTLTYSPISSSQTDQYNNWDVDFPFNDVDFEPQYTHTQQLWLLTSTDQYVCILGNASYTAELEFTNGVQTKVAYTTNDFVPIYMNEPEGIGATTLPADTLSYMSLFIALTSLISGNVTLGTTPPYNTLPGSTSVNMQIWDSSSRSLMTGLSACDDFTNNFFINNPIAIGGNESTARETPVFWNSSLNDRHDLPLVGAQDLFNKPDWMCRNRSIALAVEDLAGNITMSMLSSSDLTSQNSTNVPVLYATTRNVYQYNSRNLIISYSIAIFFALISLCVGFYSVLANGVVHSTAFSAMMATTRNSELDMLSTGHSLGAVPLATEMSGVKLRFGVLVKNGVVEEDRDGARHIGFGFEEDVLQLRKGGKYF